MDGNLMYKEWMQEWLKSKDGYVKEATYANYSMAVVNHIIPTLGDCRLEDLSEDLIQKTVLNWLTTGRIDAVGGLSEKTVRDILMIIKLSLRAASKTGLIPRIDMEIAFPRSDRISKLKVMTSESQQRLVQAVLLDMNPRTMGILICLYTGLRIGELCALQWKDIDLKSRTLSVTKTIERIYVKEINGSGATRVIFSTPKSRASIREIPISSFLQPVLRKFAANDKDIYLLTGSRDYLEPRTYRSYYDRFLKRSDLPHLKFHGLRHTFATRCIEAGADVKTVSEILGHASVNMTLNLYVHPQMEQKRKCVELIQAFL